MRMMDERFSNHPPSSMITNCGEIPYLESQSGNAPLQRLYFAVAPPKDVLLCTAASSFQDSMNLNLSFNTDWLPDPLVGGYMQSVQRLLDM